MNQTSRSGQSDFELDQYLLELYHEVSSLVYADDEGASSENKFTEYVMGLLSEAGETESIRLCLYIKENKLENIQYKINGYGIEEGFETLHIFITHFQNTNQLYRVSKPDFDKLVKWPTGFLNAAFKGYLEDIEPSTEAYGLAKLIRENYKKIDRVNVFILSNGNIPHDPPKNFSLKGLDDTTFIYHVWDAERLHRLSQSKYNREPIEIDFKETLGEIIPCLAMPSENDLYECYLAIVPGSILSTLYRNYGTRLLESNVRAFLQQTGKINKGIRDTIRDEPYMFLPYNNGLATTAQEVKTEIDKNGQMAISAVKDFQIVNGGQTTASLFHTEKKFKADLSKVFVQMKLTVIKDEIKKNETVPFISRYANSQNKVSELDLTSNNPFLQRLEELSRTTFAIDPDNSNNQTIWFLERVKGQYREALNKEPTKGKQEAFKLKFPRNQVIIKSEIAKYMNIWNQLPYHVAKGAQKNYNQFLKEVEKKFKNKKVSRIYWQDIIANAILFRAADKLFGRKNQNPIGDTNIKSQTVAYTLSYLHFLTRNRLNQAMIWNTQTIPEDLLSEIKKGLKYVYDFLNSLDVALISEAAKAEKTWNALIELKGHPLNMEVIRKYLISDTEYKARYDSDNTDIEEEVQKYNNLQKITSLGIRFWDGLYFYNLKTNILSVFQETNVSMIRKALKESGSMTDILIQKGLEIIYVIKEKGIDFEKISDLSKLNEKELVDPSILYNRLSRLREDDWKRIIDLGEQTNTFTFNEISVLKTVNQKLKRKENIDLKRLQVAQTAIDKLKRYGMKY